MGWAALKNGDLLAIASGKFDIFITTDQCLSYQQRISDFAIAVIVLVSHRNELEFLLPLVPELRKVIAQIKPGEVQRVGG